MAMQMGTRLLEKYIDIMQKISLSEEYTDYVTLQLSAIAFIGCMVAVHGT